MDMNVGKLEKQLEEKKRMKNLFKKNKLYRESKEEKNSDEKTH